jgi:AbrB family looped-hinge helix DNA binding protein
LTSTKNALTFKKVRVSDKGQISIPADVQREIGIKKGDELLLIRKGRKIVLEKPDKVIELLEGEFADIQGFTEASLAEIWGKKREDVWNQYLKPVRKS